MAKFTNKNIEFKDGQKAVFGDNDDSFIYWDGDQLVITTVTSGVTPVSDQHLTTKQYVDDLINTTSGTLQDEIDDVNTAIGSLDHGSDLAGLGDDDHTQYLLASDATDRTTFASNWTDLTDGGDTTLHDHDGISENTAARHARSHAVTSSSDHTAGNWKLLYSNGSGVVTELTLGPPNTVLKSNSATSAPTFTASKALPIELSTDTTPQLGGNLDLNSYNLVLTPSPGTNQRVNGVTASMTVGENVAFGNLLYMKSDGKLWKASASAFTTVPCIAMAAASITADAAGTVLLSGFARDDAWAWTVGRPVLVSTTAGTPSHTVPSSTGQQVQRVGIATHADRMYFNPDLTVVVA